MLLDFVTACYPLGSILKSHEQTEQDDQQSRSVAFGVRKPPSVKTDERDGDVCQRTADEEFRERAGE